MDLCVIPIELFSIVAICDDWRLWYNLILTCKALYSLLIGRKLLMIKRSIKVKCDSARQIGTSEYYKRYKYVLPNGKSIRQIIVNEQPQCVNIIESLRRFRDKKGKKYTEIVRYGLDGKLLSAAYRTDNELVFSYSIGRAYYTVTTTLGAEIPDPCKEIVLRQLNIREVESFIIHYLPDVIKPKL